MDDFQYFQLSQDFPDVYGSFNTNTVVYEPSLPMVSTAQLSEEVALASIQVSMATAASSDLALPVSSIVCTTNDVPITGVSIPPPSVSTVQSKVDAIVNLIGLSKEHSKNVQSSIQSIVARAEEILSCSSFDEEKVLELSPMQVATSTVRMWSSLSPSFVAKQLEVHLTMTKFYQELHKSHADDDLSIFHQRYDMDIKLHRSARRTMLDCVSNSRTTLFKTQNRLKRAEENKILKRPKLSTLNSKVNAKSWMQS
ncbi:uncharacterized protein LOC133796422 [Humulus lupulus]|uniref:uncharacterized protein LOC133796422 n=1 Tax=Humulus lupulus TaxID=3486 RepID=UPI002B40F6DB|nr:uncharacterized protein LOC133796422 [Humulus lupulus]